MDDDRITSGILGLGGAPVPKDASDATTAYDEESIAKRRARLREGEEEALAEDTERTGPGATGIDMGAGGEGTDISGR